mmetsp:Transcript_8498/g.38618  ORF Transcript_8498/g.38618 Transcript_8498/m.38618 type:complete len:252 (-) Transcript_8498:3751-4506(-)
MISSSSTSTPSASRWSSTSPSGLILPPSVSRTSSSPRCLTTCSLDTPPRIRRCISATSWAATGISSPESGTPRSCARASCPSCARTRPSLGLSVPGPGFLPVPIPTTRWHPPTPPRTRLPRLQTLSPPRSRLTSHAAVIWFPAWVRLRTWYPTAATSSRACPATTLRTVAVPTPTLRTRTTCPSSERRRLRPDWRTRRWRWLPLTTRTPTSRELASSASRGSTSSRFLRVSPCRVPSRSSRSRVRRWEPST